jgi:hypothetical protein
VQIVLLIVVNSFLFADSFVKLLFLFPADSLFLFDLDLLLIFEVDYLRFSFGQLMVEFSSRLLVFLSDSVS